MAELDPLGNFLSLYFRIKKTGVLMLARGAQWRTRIKVLIFKKFQGA